MQSRPARPEAPTDLDHLAAWSRRLADRWQPYPRSSCRPARPLAVTGESEPRRQVRPRPWQRRWHARVARAVATWA